MFVVFQHAQQDRALTQTDRKIDTEVADLKTMLESHKLDNIKYLAGKESDVETIKPNSIFANFQLTVFMKALIQIKYLK